MEMSTINQDTQRIQIKHIKVRKIPKSAVVDEKRIPSSKLKRINSMYSTVTPSSVNPVNTNIENISEPELYEDLLPSSRKYRIIIIIGVIIAVVISIIAIILVVKYRT